MEKLQLIENAGKSYHVSPRQSTKSRRAVTLAAARGFSYSVAMPYVFPYEDFFVVGVACVILGLLCLRMIVAKKQKGKGREADE
ncbi:MAG: hypothetical protein OXI53_02225 [Nitrospira sp.]|nr:hypothetical protein [Nitrospira sp.]MDE0485403.1 hypothetical protein [Nitrospira sp.]